MNVSTITEWVTRLALAARMSVLPPTCCLCGAAGSSASLDLCAVCRRLLPHQPVPDHPAPPVFRRVLAPFDYAYPVDHFIRALKFRGERVYARVLGTLLGEAHASLGGPPPVRLIPVPLHCARYRARGFNQAAEIARFAAGRLGLQVDASCLVRIINTKEQSGLNLRERRENVRRAFVPKRSLAGEHVALVDDVFTTGSTAAEAARALALAGAREIELWAVARVPGPPCRQARFALLSTA